jgi:hypothetical protein
VTQQNPGRSAFSGADSRVRPPTRAALRRPDRSATGAFPFPHPGQPETVERLTSTDGVFTTAASLALGATADVVIDDAWGDTVAAPARLQG